MRVLVCGGRDYSDRDTVFKSLDKLDAKYPIHEILHSGVSGADALSHQWAVKRQRVSIVVIAKRDEHGNRAGLIRNQRMIDEYGPDCCVAFPGGTGTADMVRRAREEGINVWEVK